MICFRTSIFFPARLLSNCINLQIKHLSKPKTQAQPYFSCFSSSITMINSSNSRKSVALAGYDQVPGLSSDEMDRISEQTIGRYSFNSMPTKRNGKGVAIVWFRNDLRVLDNESLFRAWVTSEAVLPVYCVDPRTFGGTTHCFGFPKTGGMNYPLILVIFLIFPVLLFLFELVAVIYYSFPFTKRVPFTKFDDIKNIFLFYVYHNSNKLVW